ncbi:outer membrane protein assembly factor BamB family protein [Streptomyces sp. NBC_00503]|uniref:outer membrane protein assembly factor BamB family protein n=1 Tax=Streptomyces sp. NBC_00503 TaxID=2903659 RepID=UPI002E8234B3|nr:PQQ-binding-like beta-propeller repeat protein [Streptomyces sp. NBC_00503]WUD79676.1 PQQ-binding-like beta-propeller repeat protein [Streptomyces sp. NBC_00503]
MGGGRLEEGLGPEDPRSAGPYRLLARWPGPRPVPPRGGMYLGRDRNHGHAVVCLLPPAACRAAEALSRGPVPGVPAVLDLNTGTEPAWVALVHTPAVSLSDVGRRPGTESGILPLDQSVRLAAEIADTLAALHARGISYGAVAPDGVWLTTARPLLMALHACRMPSERPPREPDRGPQQGQGPGRGPRPDAGPRRPEPHSRVSTVPAAFMAPEVAAGRPSSSAGDVYSLAVLLLHTATGRLPFGDGPPPVLAYRAVHDRPELPDLPGELGEVVAAALAASPKDRPTAAELRRTLAPGGLDVERPPEPLPGRVVAALAVRTQAIADLEIADADADADGDGDGHPDDRAPAGADAHEPPHPATQAATPPAPGPVPAPTTTPDASAPPTRRRVLSGLLTGAAGAALGVCGTLARSALTHGDGRTGPSAAGGGAGTSPRVPGMPPAALWRLDDPTARIRLLPVGSADRCLMTRGDVLYGHDLRTGKEVWQLPTGGSTPPVQVPGDRFLTATREGLSLCSMRDGRTQWLQRDEQLAGVLAADGATAWLRMADGSATGGYLLAAFDLDHRKELWRSPLPSGFGNGQLATTVGPETVVVEVQVPRPVFRDVTAVRTLAIAGFERSSGRMLWNRSYPDVHAGPASVVDPAGGGRLFLLSGGRAHAYDLKTGTRLWESQALVAGTNAPPFFSGGTLYLADDGTGPIVAVDPDTGRTLWEQTLNENLAWNELGSMTASATGRTLYLATLHQVTATGIPSGKRLWQTGLAGVEAREPFQLAALPGTLLVARPSAVVALPAD